jgi:ATP-dependent RNA helicase RhlE
LAKFSDFGLAPLILKAVAAEGYTVPTPIQSQAIPQVLRGRDLCGIAQTGTGKTAAFALPILQRLFSAPARRTAGACRALVLSPTRELASQIAESFRTYGRELPLSTAVVFGGVPIGAQQRRLAAGVDILVATPGRLLDLIDRKSLTLSKVEILVLDEADRMLDLGFIHALRRIVKLLPRQRQTLLFSATMPRSTSTTRSRWPSRRPPRRSNWSIKASFLFRAIGNGTLSRHCSVIRHLNVCSCSPARSTARTGSCDI